MQTMKRLLAVVLSLASLTVLSSCSSDEDGGGQQITYTQFDRMAIPAINTALIPTGTKDDFNAGRPVTDQGEFRATAEASIVALRTDVNNVPGFLPAENSPGISATTLAGILIPDIVTIDLATAVQFPNGRRLQDDVIDAELDLILNRTGLSDAIGANDKTFSATFPYLAAPF